MKLTSKNLKPVKIMDRLLAHFIKTSKKLKTLDEMNSDMNLGTCPECGAKKVREQYYADSVDYHREFECLNCGFYASE